MYIVSCRWLYGTKLNVFVSPRQDIYSHIIANWNEDPLGRMCFKLEDRKMGDVSKIAINVGISECQPRVERITRTRRNLQRLKLDLLLHSLEKKIEVGAD
jgi:hypothetical protein